MMPFPEGTCDKCGQKIYSVISFKAVCPSCGAQYLIRRETNDHHTLIDKHTFGINVGDSVYGFFGFDNASDKKDVLARYKPILQRNITFLSCLSLVLNQSLTLRTHFSVEAETHESKSLFGSGKIVNTPEEMKRLPLQSKGIMVDLLKIKYINYVDKDTVKELLSPYPFETKEALKGYYAYWGHKHNGTISINRKTKRKLAYTYNFFNCYTELSAKLTVTPQNASKYISAEQMSLINRLSGHSVIRKIAGELKQKLDDAYLAMKESKYPFFEYYYIFAQEYGINLQFKNYEGSTEKQTTLLFKDYGMENATTDVLRCSILVCLLKELLQNCVSKLIVLDFSSSNLVALCPAQIIKKEYSAW